MMSVVPIPIRFSGSGVKAGWRCAPGIRKWSSGGGAGGLKPASLRHRSHRIERREAVIQSTAIQLTLDLAYRLLKISALTRPRHRLRQLVVRYISAWRRSLVFNGKLVTPDFAEQQPCTPSHLALP